MGSIAWKVLATVTGVAAGKAATKVTTATWKAATGGTPPANKHDPKYSAAQIVAFTVVSSAVAGGMKAYAQRKAADFYTKTSGQLPPPVAKQVKKAKAADEDEQPKAKTQAKSVKGEVSKDATKAKADAKRKAKDVEAKAKDKAKKSKAKAKPATA